MIAASLFAALALGAEPLERAIEAYEQLEFERCVSLLSTEPPQAARAALYRGLCHFNLAQLDETRDDFRRALALDAAVQLPSGVSPKVVELFEAVKAEREPPGQPAAPATLTPQPAATPAEATAPERTPALRAWVGPLVFGAAAVVGAGLGTYFGLQAKQNEAAANRAELVSVADLHAHQAWQTATAANVSWVAAAVVLVAGVVWFIVERL